jgi:hypothetical protein
LKNAQLKQMQHFSSKQKISEILFGWLMHFGVMIEISVFLWILNFLEACWSSKHLEQKISNNGHNQTLLIALHSGLNVNSI